MTLVESISKLKKGMSAPDFSLKGIDGKTYSLNDFKDKPVLIIFMCNHCPYVKPKLDEINRIAKDFKNLGVVGINSNDPDFEQEDSFENMKIIAKEKDFQFTYLVDETQEVAKKFGASCTPDPFLFNEKHELIFHSRLDDTHADEPVGVHEMHEAIEEFLDLGTISIEQSPSMGCNIKWK
ncbi:thioredoxin family protein [Candidatus Woesearchaeota archaeon]|nr:thioredoxin family protein [Candidatus Woesearchaeota archaeon]